MKKILYVITKSEQGGAQHYVASLLKKMNAQGYECSLVTGSQGWLINELHDAAHTIFVFPELIRWRNPTVIFRLILKFITFFKNNRFDVIHLNSSAPLAIASIAQLFTSAKIIFTYHGLSVAHSQWKKSTVLKFLYRAYFFLFSFFIDRAIFVCNYDKEVAQKLRLCNAPSATVIYNGLSERIYLEKYGARMELQRFVRQSLDDRIIIGTLARLEYQKNIEFFIRAASSARFLKALWIVLGTGSDKFALQKSIESKGLENVIFIIDTTDEPSRYLKAFDIFLCTSRYEGCPYAILEALSAGLPIISTNVGGIPEMITDGQTGFLVNGDDCRGIVDKIRLLANNPDIRHIFSSRAKRDCYNNFRVDDMIKKTEAVYFPGLDTG